MSPHLLDTHCHVDEYPDADVVVDELANTGTFAVAVTNAPSAFVRLRQRYAGAPGLRFALGIHPLHVATLPDVEWQLFQRLLGETSYIGEVGLDFSRQGIGTRSAQERAFRRVLKSVAGLGKILTIHSRGAEEAVLDALDEFGAAPAILHWYSGPVNILHRAIAAGHYCSFNPAMSTSTRGQRVIECVPPTRALLESDGPFVRVRGRSAMPSDVHFVCQHLATVWGMEPKSVVEQTARNFTNLLQEARAAGSRLAQNRESQGDHA